MAQKTTNGIMVAVLRRSSRVLLTPGPVTPLGEG
jgi:hypothetical protein